MENSFKWSAVVLLFNKKKIIRVKDNFDTCFYFTKRKII